MTHEVAFIAEVLIALVAVMLLMAYLLYHWIRNDRENN